MSSGASDRVASAGVPNAAEQFALLVDSVREYAIYMLDRQGVVRTWNAGGERIKGYRADEIVGKHFSHMFTPEDRAAGRPQALLERAEREGSCRSEGWRVRKDGTRFWASVVITAIRDRAGELTGFAKVSRDETERHDLEERARRHTEELEAAVAERTRALEARTRELQEQAQELKRTNQELEQFNYISSHDLQEPIRMIGMYMQKLMQKGGSLTAEQQQRYMRYVLEGSERMRALIDELLRYSRIEREPARLEPIDSGAALRAALDNLARLITSRDAVIAVGTMPRVRGNLAQVTQLFQNLVENAIKYGPDRGPRVEVTAEAVAEGWRFTVRDDGIGIEAAHHERIFAVFQRLHDRGRYPGTGIGLAICKKIVEHHGGRIGVDSSPGSGAAFHFTLPRV